MGHYRLYRHVPFGLVLFRVGDSKLNFVCPLVPSPIFVGVLGVSVQTINFDVMHTVDLGVLQHYIALALMSVLEDPADLLQTG